MITITKNIAKELESYLSEHTYDRVFALTDANTQEHCLPLIKPALDAFHTKYINIEAGDINKDIRQVETVWQALSNGGASRHSLLVNIGGGMVTDLGGFAGATFKRGLHNLNIPTTLMASVDAAVGGKTGVNFNGLKNEIGSFYQPDCVMIDCTFLRTLDRSNILSGYAEMLKHGLISDRETFYKLLNFDLEDLTEMVSQSVSIKEKIVREDPHEHGIRKALNLGHTVGHAIESLSFVKNQPMLHGHAVAAGLVSELYLSHKVCGMDIYNVRALVNFVKEHYPRAPFGCNDYSTLTELMTHDKKNSAGEINFTLLGDVGDIRINRHVGVKLIEESLDFYCENM